MEVVVLCIQVDGTTEASITSSHNVGREATEGFSNVL
jgi:hypothetical protein